MTEKVRPKRRVFMWIFLVIQALFVTWIIVGSTSVSSSFHDCSHLTGQALDQCNMSNAGSGVGTTIGIGLVVGLWVAVDLILGITYAIYRAARKKS